MGALNKSVGKRTYRERAQPASRSHLGLLEKKKDYRQRAKDYKSKKRRLQTLQEKVGFRNKDEFYNAMVKRKTTGGVHERLTQGGREYTNEEIRLMKSQDVKYLQMKESIDRKKIGRLQSQMYLSLRETKNGGEEGAGETGGGILDGDGKMEIPEDLACLDMDDVDMDAFLEEEARRMRSLGGVESSANRPSRKAHTLFVENERELEDFDPVEKFDTLPEFVERPTNRPRRKQLENPEYIVNRKAITANSSTSDADVALQRSVKFIKKEGKKKKREVDARRERQEKLRSMQQSLELQKHLMGKGKRTKIEKRDGRVLYKWDPVRKR